MVVMAPAAVPPVAPMVAMTVVMVMMTSSPVVPWVPGPGLDGRAEVVDDEVDVVMLGVAAAAATAEEGGDARLPPVKQGQVA